MSEKRKDPGIKSACGKGTISRLTHLGWAYDRKKANNGSCVYIERSKPEASVPAFTFDEWAAKGFRVIAGQKSHSRNRQGVAVFLPDQVQPAARKPKRSRKPRAERRVKKHFPVDAPPPWA